MAPTFEGWACVELFGHRVVYALVSEVTMFGATFARLDIPTEPATFEFKSASAIYGIRPLSEEQVRNYHKPRRLDRALSGGEDADLVDDDVDSGVHDAELEDDELPPPRNPAMDPINPELGMQPMSALDEDF